MKIALFARSLSLMLLVGGVREAAAHPSDISYLKIKVLKNQAQLRFTLNLLSLSRFIGQLDKDLDQQVSRDESQASMPLLGRYLKNHIKLEVNGKIVPFPDPEGFDCVWPTEVKTVSTLESELAMRFVDAHFRLQVEPVLSDFWLDFDVWGQVGPLGTIEAEFEQEGTLTEVSFSQAEPDYFYDTGFAAEQLFQRADVSEKPSPSQKTSIWPQRLFWPLFAALFALAVGGVLFFRRRSAR